MIVAIFLVLLMALFYGVIYRDKILYNAQEAEFQERIDQIIEDWWEGVPPK